MDLRINSILRHMGGGIPIPGKGGGGAGPPQPPPYGQTGIVQPTRNIAFMPHKAMQGGNMMEDFIHDPEQATKDYFNPVTLQAQTAIVKNMSKLMFGYADPDSTLCTRLSFNMSRLQLKSSFNDGFMTSLITDPESYCQDHIKSDIDLSRYGYHIPVTQTPINLPNGERGLYSKFVYDQFELYQTGAGPNWINPSDYLKSKMHVPMSDEDWVKSERYVEALKLIQKLFQERDKTLYDLIVATSTTVMKPLTEKNSGMDVKNIKRDSGVFLLTFILDNLGHISEAMVSKKTVEMQNLRIMSLDDPKLVFDKADAIITELYGCQLESALTLASVNTQRVMICEHWLSGNPQYQTLVRITGPDQGLNAYHTIQELRTEVHRYYTTYVQIQKKNKPPKVAQNATANKDRHKGNNQQTPNKGKAGNANADKDKNKLKCGNCKKNHKTEDCRLEGGKKEMKCTGCGKYGHLIKNCFANKQSHQTVAQERTPPGHESNSAATASQNLAALNALTQTTDSSNERQ